MENAEWMPRAPRGNRQYWDKWCDWTKGALAQARKALENPPGDPSFEAQFLRIQARRHLELMLRLYSAGAPIASMAPWFDGLLCAWEQSQALEPSVYPPEIVHNRRTWAVNFDLYGESAWIISLALVLQIPDDQWQRLLLLIGNEGQDAVLDALIASRQSGRRIGAKVLYPKPYARLHAVIAATPEQRPHLLLDFVQHWYAELDRKATRGRPATFNRLYWYKLGDENFEGGAYFGRWCIEAAAAAKIFSINDAQCLDLEHYPGDLLRPDGPNTHIQRTLATPSTPARPWWRRWVP